MLGAVVNAEARANRQAVYIWEAARRVIMLDPKWQNGEYPPNRQRLTAAAT